MVDVLARRWRASWEEEPSLLAFGFGGEDDWDEDDWEEDEDDWDEDEDDWDEDDEWEEEDWEEEWDEDSDYDDEGVARRPRRSDWE